MRLEEGLPLFRLCGVIGRYGGGIVGDGGSDETGRQKHQRQCEPAVRSCTCMESNHQRNPPGNVYSGNAVRSRRLIVTDPGRLGWEG